MPGKAGILALVLVVFALATLNNHDFADLLSVQQLLVGASVMMILAVGETLVMITRNVDLSIGSVLGLSAYVVGELVPHRPIPSPGLPRRPRRGPFVRRRQRRHRGRPACRALWSP